LLQIHTAAAYPEGMGKALTLAELIPKPAEFYLSKMKKTYKLRPFNIEDGVYLRDTYGENDIVGMFSDNGTFLDKCIIVYLLLSDEDRADFQYSEGKGFDEVGRPVEKKVSSGPQKLCLAVTGIKEVQDVTIAMLKTMGISQPILDKIEIKEVQKKRKKRKKRIGKK